MNFKQTRREFGKTVLAGAAVAAMTPMSKALAGDLSHIDFQSTWINDPEFVGNFIAIDKGYYKDEGIDLNYIPGGPDVIPEGSLLTGKADFALTSVINCAQAVVEKGAPFKVVGTQFQKSPDSIISLEETGIKTVKDLAGKTVACPPLNIATLKAVLDLHGMKMTDMKVVPYAFDPTPLATGEVDAVVDFMTSLPYIVEQASGKKTSYFLFYDVGLEFYANLLTVTEDTLKSKRKELIGFMKATRKGWKDAFADPDKYVNEFEDTWFKGNGYTHDAAIFHSHVQIGLIDHPKGVLWMDDDVIDKNIESLKRLGIDAPRDMFDTSLLQEL